ncbi:hypothetical protein PHMEG_00026499 [Phytophthora megakarya]|uniref:RxLR effector protein n=1 Tax=Phytophthora megakarya TaxID=4795 RepID=A0A225VAV3_9STRA|nr:hypothetical protein PHMEG_00026499 [Phytophthora megakarya]
MISSDGTNRETIPHQNLRGLKTVEKVDEIHNPEVRGINKFPALEKLKNLRKIERIKEMQEALARAKVNVKEAAEAAAKAAAEAAAKAAKAKLIQAIADQLDDITVKKLLQDPEAKKAVFEAWYKEKISPQLVYNSFELPGKYTDAKWKKIGEGYLDFDLDMRLAAAGLPKRGQ